MVTTDRRRIAFRLRDLNEALVEAWNTEFVGAEDVTVSRGDILGERADAIVSPANSFGFMDGGIDLHYLKRFGWDLQERLREALARDHEGELAVGQAIIIETFDPTIPYLISAPTMRVPMDVSTTANAYLAFRAAIRAVQEHNRTSPSAIGSILCPGVGTGVGRMAPRTCAVQMQAAFCLAYKGQTLAPMTLAQAHAEHERLVRGR